MGFLNRLWQFRDLADRNRLSLITKSKPAQLRDTLKLFDTDALLNSYSADRHCITLDELRLSHHHTVSIASSSRDLYLLLLFCFEIDLSQELCHFAFLHQGVKVEHCFVASRENGFVFQKV